MRLFLAIFPPKEYIRYFADVYREFDKEQRNLRPTPVDQVHLTLKFIGANVSNESKDIIVNALKRNEGNFTKPTIEITHIQFGFDYQTFPHHLIAQIAEDPGLESLFDETHSIIKEQRLRDTIRWKDKHSDDFHITIARLKEKKSHSTARKISAIAKEVDITPPPAFTPETIEVMHSIITTKGPIYKSFASIKL